MGCVLVIFACFAFFCTPGCNLESLKEATQDTKSRFRLGVINSREVLTTCDQGARLVREIQEKYAPRRAYLDQLRLDVDKLREKQRSPVDNNSEEQVQEKIREFAKEEQQLFQDVSREEAERFGPLVELVNRVIVDFSKENGISAVQEQGAFIYVGADLNITESIIKRINTTKAN